MTLRLPARTRALPRRAAVAAVAAAVLLPDRLRLDHRFPFGAAVAWRPHAAPAALLAAAVLVRGRRTRPLAAVLGAAAVPGVVAAAGRLRRRPVGGRGDRDLTILACNAYLGRADAGALATLLERETPDLVALSEAGPDLRDKLMPLVAGLGYRSWVSTPPGTPDGPSVTVLVSARAGEVTVRGGPGMRRRHLEVTGGVLGARRFVAVHPEAPMGPGRAALWEADLGLVAGWTRQTPAPIIAGDFNATLDHAAMRDALGDCRSAAEGTGAGLVGTFPAGLPRWWGVQIDHVLVPADAVTTRFAILDVEGSDHRAC